MKAAFVAALAAVVLSHSADVGAAEIKVLHGGAFTQLVEAVVPEFQRQTGHKVTTQRETVGALQKRIEGGEAFDLAILTPAAVDDLAKKGKITAGSRVNLVQVGVGVVVKEGAPRPDVSTVDAFKRALVAAKSVAYIDPQAGGSSGIYVAGLLEKLGIANEVKPKAVLIHGGAVAEHVAKGEAELGIHQISEILPVKGITLVGALPKEIQNYTIYAAGIAANSANVDVVKALIKAFGDAKAVAAMKQKGMEPAGS
ncbi:MAG TPA: substrate-binding domain-containing protein [Xanthobacteraceae bacterium]|jgi:molybdate transport system substrate-binding protein|nr:substrate-binding domain-containing protein [Xanthobacteraceae bacterium]